jgi:hypothetical protein
MQHLIYPTFNPCKKIDHKHFNLGKNIFSIYATINLCVEDLDDVEEGESGDDVDGGGDRRGEGAGM